MAVRVRLNDGVHFVVRADLEEFRKAYEEALKNNAVLEVENGNGRMRVLNPQQILYFEDASQEVSEDGDAVAPVAEDQPVHQ